MAIRLWQLRPFYYSEALSVGDVDGDRYVEMVVVGKLRSDSNALAVIDDTTM